MLKMPKNENRHLLDANCINTDQPEIDLPAVDNTLDYQFRACKIDPPPPPPPPPPPTSTPVFQMRLYIKVPSPYDLVVGGTLIRVHSLSPTLVSGIPGSRFTEVFCGT